MNLENIMLSERRHHERPHISFHLHEMSKIGYFYTDRKYISDGLELRGLEAEME